MEEAAADDKRQEDRLGVESADVFCSTENLNKHRSE